MSCLGSLLGLLLGALAFGLMGAGIGDALTPGGGPWVITDGPGFWIGILVFVVLVIYMFKPNE
ncbi:MAG: hypothetical protein UU81_C0038G0006 [Microgenomates group bacterium GW2011_GWC1_41_8]|uniref:Uncharacterized protein n=3 Tax=Candidatus Roizmaniibacteriota TaxID=1752723 RepID=A0A0G0XAT5_9BACT|nr:MAG: hypothetical protein UT85_C0025G0009 [Candidatus Levybacteria bacterium GW2011_GWA2_40_16]KKR72342.1 MAG: hypothetical protein UU14_C0007G0023 [Candidatus Roizmanbacteria bacterium GW2011_GWB1_40_7]KKR91449.1 MAG: hypothetical protein UU41_C0037G0004 [Candidatus Roizmanbacteria bacterium GW2011_GWA1_41_13]KKS22030.1 MAG: hypothetical protein UU78_C0024G0004 [Candidatus Roizmanbacteria bacterium GW2011_GWC2_41_7]KKS23178.1 MAG: hypothetical protein UU81_C0038G0006 [Microgenomates group b